MDNCITISQKRNQTYYTSPLEVLDGSINLNVKTFLKIDHRGFPGGSVVKSPPAMQETQGQALVQEDPTCRGTSKPARRKR